MYQTILNRMQELPKFYLLKLVYWPLWSLSKWALHHLLFCLFLCSGYFNPHRVLPKVFLDFTSVYRRFFV